MSDENKISSEEYKDAVIVLLGQVSDLFDHLQLSDEEVERFIKTETWNFVSMHDPEDTTWRR